MKHFKQSLLLAVLSLLLIPLYAMAADVNELGNIVFRSMSPTITYYGDLTIQKGDGTNAVIRSGSNTATLRINTRDYTASSGSILGFSSKPNSTVAGASIQGMEIQPRFASGIGGVNLIGANISAITKGATGNLSGEVHVLELETDFDQGTSPTRTITGDVTLLRFSGGFPSTMTFSGKKTAMQLAPAQNGPYDGFIKFDSTNTDIVLDAGTGDNSAATSNGFGTNPAGMKVVKVLFGSTAYYIPLFSSNAN